MGVRDGLNSGGDLHKQNVGQVSSSVKDVSKNMVSSVNPQFGMQGQDCRSSYHRELRQAVSNQLDPSLSQSHEKGVLFNGSTVYPSTVMGIFIFSIDDLKAVEFFDKSTSSLISLGFNVTSQSFMGN